MMEGRKRAKFGDGGSEKVTVVRKILAQLQHLLQIVEKRSSKYEENRRLLEVIQKSLEEIRCGLKKREDSLTTSIEMIWSSIEETAFCLKNLEEVSELDSRNPEDVYLPCYKRLDSVVREYHGRKIRKWKKLRTKLQILSREKEENCPYKPGRQWEVVKFHFDSDDDCRIIADPFADLPDKRKKAGKRSTEGANSMKTSTSRTGAIPSEDDENFAKYLENEAQLLHEPRTLVMTLKTVSTNTVQPFKVANANSVQDIVLSQPAPVLQELSLNTEPDESSRQTESSQSLVNVTQEPLELPLCISKPVEAIQPSSIANLEFFTGPICNTFEEMGLEQSLICGVNLWGILNPMMIQATGIPACLLGRDMIVQAGAGEGKTTLAAIATLNKIRPEIRSPQTIFLLPTPELAELAMRAMGDLGTFMDITGVCCKYPQGIETCKVFLGTPLNAHNYISNRKLSTDAVKMLVIDSADEMPLEASSSIIKVLYNLGGDTQVIVLTRVLTPEIACLSQKLRNPVYISCSIPNSQADIEIVDITDHHEIENEVPSLPSPSIDFNNMNQFYVVVGTDELKIRVLDALADTMETEQAIIFCNTAQKADWLATKIRENEKGLEVCSVHGGRQNKEHLMALFQAGVSRVLITTDFITRSNFKLKPIPLVLNYEFPELAENYTKRLMCAGRTKKSSSLDTSLENPVLVFTFVNLENLPVLENLAKIHDFTVTPMSSQSG